MVRALRSMRGSEGQWLCLCLAEEFFQPELHSVLVSQ